MTELLSGTPTTTKDGYGCRTLQWHSTGNRHDWFFVSRSEQDGRSFDKTRPYNGANSTVTGKTGKWKAMIYDYDSMPTLELHIHVFDFR